MLPATVAAQQAGEVQGAAAPPSLVFVDAARVGPGLVLVRLVPVDTPPAMPDSLPRRPRAVEHSDAYYTRLTIHRWASYTMPPLFVAQYALGEKLMRQRERGEDAGSTRNLHGVVAGGIAGLFAINTVTGVWNLWEDRNEPAGRTRRIVHVVTMLVADAGFVATGATAEGEDDGGEGGGEGGGEISTHRALAYGSMGLAAVSTAIMWFWKD
jgi:hypothetical protein